MQSRKLYKISLQTHTYTLLNVKMTQNKTTREAMTHKPGKPIINNWHVKYTFDVI